MNDNLLSHDALNCHILTLTEAMQKLNEFKRFVILLHDDN